MVKGIIYILACLILASCETFDFGGLVAASSSAEERFKVSRKLDVSEFYPEVIESMHDNYSFVVATDIHAKENQFAEIDRLADSVRRHNGSFLVLLGDNLHIAGDRLDPIRERMDAVDDFGCYMAIGNHDVYRDGYQKTYRRLFGPTSYLFTVKTPEAEDLCIVLDSANGTLGRGQIKWLEATLETSRGGYRHCFVFTHASFFLPDGHVDIVSTYSADEYMKLLDMFARNNVTAVFTGHSHAHDHTALKGVDYITLNPLLNNPRAEYAVVECLSDDSVDWNFGCF